MAEINFRDVTILYTENDQQWCQYIKDRFLTDKIKLNIQTVNVNSLHYKFPPEVEVAVRESHVVVLLATSYMMDYMESQTDWFPEMLRNKKNSKFTTIVAALIALDQPECQSVLQNSKYVLDKEDEFKMVEVDTDGQNIQTVITTILQYRDENAARKVPPKGQQPPKKPPSVAIEVVPTNISKCGDTVALLFSEEIKGEVTVNFTGIKDEVKTKKVNPYSVTFTVPDVTAEKIGLQVNVDGKRVQRSHLYNKKMDLNTTSVEFMRQSYNLATIEELDKRLASVFNKSLCSDGTANRIFDEVIANDNTEEGRTENSSKYPTLLHWAAAYGLSELCSALLSSASVSAAACSIDNCDGHDPAELARIHGHQELYDLLFDFAETKEIADACNLYVQCFAKKSDTDSAYQIMNSSVSGAPTPFQPSPFQPAPFQPSPFQPAPFQPPKVGPKPPPPRKKSEEQAPVDDIYIQPDEDYPSSQPSAEKKGIGLCLSRGAMGSRSQTELIRIQEEFKNGTFSIEDAEMLFKAWKERYETGNAVSFKDRQNALHTLRTDHCKTFEALKTGKTKKPTKLEKNDSFQAEISEPFFLRAANKSLIGRDSNASSASTISSISTTSSDSGRDSTDSRYMSASDDYESKRTSLRDMYIDLKDYEKVEQLPPPPLPPPRRVDEKTTTIKSLPGKPAPPPTKPKTASFKK